MTIAEQLAVISAPTFLAAVGEKVVAAKSALGAVDVSAGGGYATHVDGVEVWWLDQPSGDIQVRFGMNEQGLPMYDVTVPFQWFEAP